MPWVDFHNNERFVQNKISNNFLKLSEGYNFAGNKLFELPMTLFVLP